MKYDPAVGDRVMLPDGREGFVMEVSSGTARVQPKHKDTGIANAPLEYLNLGQMTYLGRGEDWTEE